MKMICGLICFLFLGISPANAELNPFIPFIHEYKVTARDCTVNGSPDLSACGDYERLILSYKDGVVSGVVFSNGSEYDMEPYAVYKTTVDHVTTETKISGSSGIATWTKSTLSLNSSGGLVQNEVFEHKMTRVTDAEAIWQITLARQFPGKPDYLVNANYRLKVLK